MRSTNAEQRTEQRSLFIPLLIDFKGIHELAIARLFLTFLFLFVLRQKENRKYGLINN